MIFLPSHSAEISVLEKKVDLKHSPPKSAKGKTMRNKGGGGYPICYLISDNPLEIAERTLFVKKKLGDFLREGVTQGGGFTARWEVQCLSAMVPWHPDRHASATSPSLLRDDQNLRDNRVTVQWRRAGCRASPYRHPGCRANVVPPGLGPPPLKMPEKRVLWSTFLCPPRKP